MKSSVALSMSSAEAAARSGTYRLLARLWLREVDRELLRKLCSPPLCDSFVEAGGILPAGDNEWTIEQLAIDYCQLFIGPANHLPPFQSVWQSGQFQGAAIASMEKFVEVVGYDTDALPSGTMLDHLGVQFDVMGHILDQIPTCQSEQESPERAWEIAHCYFAMHLTWPAKLLEVAAPRATTEFYRSIFMLTCAFLDDERQG
jgi:TorA maturation chaperone TorD